MLMLVLLLLLLLSLVYCSAPQIDFVFKTKWTVHGISACVRPSMCHCCSRQVLVELNEAALNRFHHRKSEKCKLHLTRNLYLILIKIHNIEPIPFEWPNDFYKTAKLQNWSSAKLWMQWIGFGYFISIHGYIYSQFFLLYCRAWICGNDRVIGSCSERWSRIEKGDPRKHVCAVNFFVTVHITRNTNHNYYFGK